MKIDLFDINQFIKENNVLEVKSPVFFQYDGTPSIDGLFSYEIFGVTDNDRKNRFGYIDLGAKYIHPLIFSMLTSRMGSMKDIIYGNKYAVIADKKIKVVPEDFNGAQTGIDFLYNNYDKIQWMSELEELEEDSLDKKTRLKFLNSIRKEEFFIDKWLVLPPFYRAENTKDRTMGDIVNKLYKDLISRSSAMKVGFSFSLFGNATRLRVQNLLLNIYRSTMSPLSGKHIQKDGSLAGTSKNSMLRRNLLGKNIDFTASNVITSPSVSRAESPKDMPVPFGYAAFPIATLMSLFQPFFVNEAVLYLDTIIRSFAIEKSSIISRINEHQYNVDIVEKLIKRYVRTESERFTPIYIEFYGLSGKKETAVVEITEYKNQNDLNRKVNGNTRTLNLTDMFYQIAESVLKDKHVYATRYPITNFQNIYPVKIKILTTVKTKKDIYLETYGAPSSKFDNYPVMPEDVNSKPSDYKFYNVLIPGNWPLAALGGDYDGDMLYLKSVFSVEANKEADKLIRSKTNILNATGGPSRGLSHIGREAVVGIYALTK